MTPAIAYAKLQYHARKPFSAFWQRFCPDVIVQRRLGKELFSVSLRDHTMWVSLGDACDVENVPLPSGGHVWDLGCNIGLYSVRAARLGCKVTAFDISETNVACLKQTATLNALPIEVVCAPVTPKPGFFKPAKTGHTEESMDANGSVPTITFLDAEEAFGLPTFIKMDIQGGEKDFLQSEYFRQWIFQNKIEVYLEVHNDCANYVWPEFKQIGRIHYHLCK